MDEQANLLGEQVGSANENVEACVCGALNDGFLTAALFLPFCICMQHGTPSAPAGKRYNSLIDKAGRSASIGALGGTQSMGTFSF